MILEVTVASAGSAVALFAGSDLGAPHGSSTGLLVTDIGDLH